MNYDYDGNEFPLAYLITFRSYGTWLHGDSGGAMNRRGRNIYGTRRIPPNENLEGSDRSQLKHSPVRLDASHRGVVEEAIREVCVYRGYNLRALNIRTNHVHTVVSAQVAPELIMNGFKAYATRLLRATCIVGTDVSPWVRRGSTRYLWKPHHVERAIDYVITGQGGGLPRFD
jgi:REP element-mobilizing transposase RayT